MIINFTPAQYILQLILGHFTLFQKCSSQYIISLKSTYFTFQSFRFLHQKLITCSSIFSIASLLFHHWNLCSSRYRSPTISLVTCFFVPDFLSRKELDSCFWDRDEFISEWVISPAFTCDQYKQLYHRQEWTHSGRISPQNKDRLMKALYAEAYPRVSHKPKRKYIS